MLTAQSTSPLIVRGSEKFVNIANPDNFDYIDDPPKRTKYEQAWNEVYGDLSVFGRHRAALSALGLELLGTLEEYRSWDQENWNPTHPNTGHHLFPVSEETNPDDPTGSNGKMFPTSAYAFFRSLKVCALSLLEAGNDASMASIITTGRGSWPGFTGICQAAGLRDELPLGGALRAGEQRAAALPFGLERHGRLHHDRVRADHAGGRKQGHGPRRGDGRARRRWTRIGRRLQLRRADLACVLLSRLVLISLA